MKKRLFCILFLAALIGLQAQGQSASLPGENGERQSSVLVGLGAISQYDTYLSPIEYQGTQFSLVAESSRPLKAKPVTFQSLLYLDLNSSQTKAETNMYLGGDIHYDAGWHYNWHDVLAPRLTFFAGGLLGASVGGLYSTRSGNNPANAHASVRLSASLGAKYRLHIGRLPVSLKYQADLPILGAAFSPNYGQSYYEMWQRGGYDHNIVFTHPGNALSFRQACTVGLHFGRTALLLGYLGDIRQATLNHLRQHQYSHSLLVGWSKTF